MAQSTCCKLTVRTTGYLVVEDFASAAEVASLRQRAEQLVDAFDAASVASVFSTRNQARRPLHLEANLLLVYSVRTRALLHDP